MARIRVWDLPTRLFHWLLVVCVVGAFICAKLGGNAMVWHGRFGVAILALLVFRIVWGFVGSTYARFRQFVRGPAAIMSYLQGRWSGEGHNPLGALSVLAMLGTLLLLVSTGLFSNDDIAFNGPLYDLVNKATSDRLVGLHKSIEPLLIFLVLAHLGAIGFYVKVRREVLIRPMVTGNKESSGTPAAGGGFAALLVALVLAAAAAYAASGVWIERPVPAAVSPDSTPAF